MELIAKKGNLMKNLSLIILFIFVSLSANAQDRDNLISKAEFEQIAFNNITIKQLYDSKGALDLIISYFGNPIKQEKDDLYTTFIYQKNLIGINGEVGRITRLEINDTSWSLKVKGNVFKVGDPVSKFQQVFGSSLKVIVPPNSTNKKFISFSYQGNDFDSIHIDVDPITNKVKQISYYVIP